MHHNLTAGRYSQEDLEWFRGRGRITTRHSPASEACSSSHASLLSFTLAISLSCFWCGNGFSYSLSSPLYNMMASAHPGQYLHNVCKVWPKSFLGALKHHSTLVPMTKYCYSSIIESLKVFYSPGFTESSQHSLKWASFPTGTMSDIIIWWQSLGWVSDSWRETIFVWPWSKSCFVIESRLVSALWSALQF